MASVRKRTWKTAAGETRTGFAVDFVDANGARQRRQFATKREADAFRVEVEGQLRSGAFRADASRVTVKEVADEFITYCDGRAERRERMTTACRDVYVGHIRNYICPDPTRHAGKRWPTRLKAFSGGIGNLKLAQLTTRRVSEFRDRLREAGVSITTTRRILGTLLQMLNYAVQRDLVSSNAAKGVKVLGRRDEGARKIVPPSKVHMRMLLDAADPDFRVLLLVASSTGVRAGELYAIRWRHVDFAAAELTVETRVDREGQEDVTKTKAGMRTVPLGASVLSALKEWKLRTKRKKPDDLVFPSRSGSYLGHGNMVKRKFIPLFSLLAERHAEDPDCYPAAPARFNWHALRHFAISCWIEAGLSPKTVQTFAGHSSLQVTMDRYGHLFKSDDHKKVMDKIARDLLGS